jgi:hypothetical protein
MSVALKETEMLNRQGVDTMTEQPKSKDDNRQWFLRINGETVFGPVSTQGLIVWAEQGRILPGHEVSPDRKKWQQAVSLELLDMRWYVDDGEGELRGPLNRLAAEALIKSGKVAEGAQLVSADEIEAGPVAEPHADGRRAGDAQREDALRRRVRELEARVGELRGAHAKPAAGAGAEALESAQRERDALAAALKAAEAQRDAALGGAEKDAQAHERSLEQVRQHVRKLERQLEETRTGGERTAELERALQFHERKAGEEAQILATREAELAAERTRLAAAAEQLEQARTEGAAAEAAKREAEARREAAETALTGLLNDANARDITYQEKIAELEKMCAQPPEATARFFADQAAVYELIDAEVSELGAALEQEKAQAEQLKAWSAQRLRSLQERRQKLFLHLGGSPGEMTRRAVREQPSDPQIARLRAEVENLRVAYQREVRLAETHEREWQERKRVHESEEVRLRSQVVAGEKKAQRVQELEELVRERERELAAEQKNREEEREQFEANQRALLMRIETLERAARPSTPEERQSSEARTVKLASWMRLKK